LPADQVQYPDWITGAALMLRRSAIGDQAVFDTRFFLYSEELDLCRRLRAKGWEVLYEPAAVIHHAGGRSASQDDYLRNVRFHDSKATYMAKHHGRPLELVFRLFIALSLMLSGLEDWAKGNLVTRESWRIRRAAMYVRSGLWHLKRLISRMGG
jgi:GT2 family glycosyltransferase